MKTEPARALRAGGVVVGGGGVGGGLGFGLAAGAAAARGGGVGGKRGGRGFLRTTSCLSPMWTGSPFSNSR